MRKSILSAVITLGSGFGLVLAMFAGSAGVFAQATPEGVTNIHPAHIHSGACPEPGDVVFPLENVVLLNEGIETSLATPDAISSPVADAAPSGTPVAGDAVTGLGSTTIVEASLEDILAEEHAIVLHLDPEQMEVFIACGDIAGMVENNELVVDLDELNNSGFSGWAILTDNGDETTTVVIEGRHVGVDMQGTPMATPQP